MAAARILRALRLLADEPGGMTLAQLHLHLGVPKTSMHALLRGLVAEGYLQRSDTDCTESYA
jgi:DNA-binding IclR family transcriptional regulator